MPVALTLAAASWVYVIGPDLRGGAKAQQPRSTAAARPTKVAGPARVAPPQPRDTSAVPATPTADRLPFRLRAPVRYALLSVARDHVARRVHAAWGSVPDLDAVKGADVDLVERGLHLAGFPLREAIIRHRFVDHPRYGLRGRPPATEAQRRRALSKKTLRVFLDRFAQQLPTTWDGVSGDTYLGGDIVLVERSRGARRRQMFAVVTDRTDRDGVSLLVTLDPRESVAREQHPLSMFRVVRHYRLSSADLVHARAKLKMPRAAERGRLL